MAIIVGSNFSLQTGLPLDDRDIVADNTARDAVNSGRRYQGMVVHVLSSGTNYQLVGGIANANWTVFGGGGSFTPTSTDTLQNKTLDNTNQATLKDNKFTLQDDGDITKQAQFQASSITTGTTATLTLPPATTTLVGTDTSQTLTNKTLVAPAADIVTFTDQSSTPSAPAAGTRRIYTKTDGKLYQVNSAGTEVQVGGGNVDNTSTVTVKDVNLTIQDDGDTTKQAKFEVSGIPTATTATYTLPGATTTIVGTTSTQTLTNKTLTAPIIDATTYTQIATPSAPAAGSNKLYVKSDGFLYNQTSGGTETKIGGGDVTNANSVTVKDANLTIQDDVDTTKQFKFEASGITTATTRTLTVPDANDTLVGKATTDTLTNKTLTAPNINAANLLFGLATTTNKLTIPYQAFPTLHGTQSIGQSFAYDNTNQRPVFYDGTGIRHLTSGTGGINYLSAFYDSFGTGGIATYNDGAAATPVDGTGGTVTGLTTPWNTTTPLRRAINLQFAKSAANAQGLGWSIAFTVDRAEAEGLKRVYLSFNYRTSANFASNDMGVYLYDVTAGALVPISTLSGSQGLPAATTTGTFFGWFTPNSTSTSFRLVFHIASTNALAYTMDWTSLRAFPDNYLPTNATTAWQTYTPTFVGFGTVTGIDFQYRQVGGSYEIRGRWIPGTPTAVGAAVSLPNGALASSLTANRQAVGIVYKGASAASASKAFSVIIDPGAGGFNFSFFDTAGTINPQTPQNGSALTNAGEIWTMPVVSIPIQNLANGNMISSTELVVQTQPPMSTTSAIKTPTASANYDLLTGNSITLTPGRYELTGIANFNSPGSSAVFSDAGFGFFASNGTDSSTAPSDLSTLASSLTIESGRASPLIVYNTIRQSGGTVNCAPLTVRVLSTVTIYMVTYSAMTTPANARIITYFNAARVPDYSTFGYYNETKSVEATVTYGSFGGALNTWAAIASVTLTAGEWDMYGYATMASTSGGMTSYMTIGASAGGNLGVDYVAASPTTTGYYMSMAMQKQGIIVPYGQTVVWAMYYQNNAASNVGGKIWGRRIKPG